jgi:histidine triad (HIT) family protein
VECVFCAIVGKRAPAKIVHEWSDAVAIVPLDPVVEGHVIVIPRAHVGDFTADPVVTGAVAARAATLAAAEGWQWNLITSAGEHATQTVMHLHVHLVPRREGDGLALPWTGQRRRATGGRAAVAG